MGNCYYEALAGNTDAALVSFFGECIGYCDWNGLNEEGRSRAAGLILKAILDTSADEIIRIVGNGSEKIVPASISQFSNIADAEKTPEIVEVNADANFELIGYILNHNASSGAQQKYGENQYKLAAQMGLVTFDKICHRITPVGAEYIKTGEERMHIRRKLFLRIPLVRRLIIAAKEGPVNGFDAIRNGLGDIEKPLADSTTERRSSNIRTLLDEACMELVDIETVKNNIRW